MATIVNSRGSLDDGLEARFRLMILQIAEGLDKEDCNKISFIENLPISLKSNSPLDVLISLKNNGCISPANVDKLEQILTSIKKINLMSIVNSYKKSTDYRGAESRKREERKLARDTGTLSKDRKERLKRLYAMLNIHTTCLTQVMEFVRLELDKECEDDEDRVMQKFTKVVKDGEIFIERFQTELADISIKSRNGDTSSSSSTEDSPVLSAEAQSTGEFTSRSYLLS